MTRKPWTCYCGKTCRGGSISRHRRTCDVYRAKPALISKAEADAWLGPCDQCRPELVDALVDPRIQARLAALKVPHSLHIHGSDLSPYISLRFTVPMQEKFTCDAAVGQTWESVFRELAEVLETRKQHALFFFGEELTDGLRKS